MLHAEVTMPHELMAKAPIGKIPSAHPEASQSDIYKTHFDLAKWNKKRLSPKGPSLNWRKEMAEEAQLAMLEGEMLEWEKAQIADLVQSIPKDERLFLSWFEELLNAGPGQNDSLFDWLESEADYQQMRWFIRQEVAGEAGFDDLAALTQVKLPTQAKLEVARNYWDEMGRGQEKGMHGPMLTKLAEEMSLEESSIESTVPESLALANILIGLAMNRRYAYHSVGALGAIELTAPGRSIKVYRGLKRLGLSPEAQRYYLLHSSLDVKHSASWNREVIGPIVAEKPETAQWIAEGALMRLHAGARCFERYRKTLWSDRN